MDETVRRRRALSGAFQGLGVEERAILCLRYLKDQPPDSIAASLGIPEAEVQSRLDSSLATLARAAESPRLEHAFVQDFLVQFPCPEVRPSFIEELAALWNRANRKGRHRDIS